MQDRMSKPVAQPIEAYCALMEEVKRRIALVRQFTGGQLTLGREDFDAETVCVHMRKILEVIAFGSLVAHRDAYESAHTDLESRWRAKEILKRVSAIHANFYPKPVTPHRTDGNWHMEEVSTNFLTWDDFEKLYDKCGDMLHFWNPFRAGPRVMDFGRSLDEWCNLIENLLRHHIVWLRTEAEPCVLVNSVPESGEGWLIDLIRPEDGRTHALLFAPVLPESAADEEAENAESLGSQPA